MRAALGKNLTPEIAARVCEKSGTHILKLISPRLDGDHAVLRLASQSNQKAAVIPSVNAPDIPYAKVIFRPLEIVGNPAKSVVDHILNPEDYSDRVLDAFASVFGLDVLDAIRDTLLADAPAPTKLGAGEFPIVFVPNPNGGDLQVTPVAPAYAFMGMKQVTEPFFQKKSAENPTPPRGRWTKQAVSSKPQNISGAIGGPRVRFLATLPEVMRTEEADLYRFVHGGGFPAWREEGVDTRVLRYADMLDGDLRYNDMNTRAALDRIADRLIADADAFLRETLSDARDLALRSGKEGFSSKETPGVARLILNRRWGSPDLKDRARKALTSPHFEYRAGRFGSAGGDA
jgi:hypothetical protein